MKPALLIEKTRGQLTETQHFGFILAVDKKENIILKIGDDENKNFWLRSAAKPFQSSLILESGAYDKFNLTLQELAVCCASHTGTQKHTETILSVLSKIGLQEKDLQCGVHEPLDKKTKESLIKKNIAPSQLHNNCSGKHAGMLAICIANRWDIQDYLDLSHPLQNKITESIAKFCNFDKNNINTGTDGCSAPVHALPFCKMGVGFLNLFLDKDYENIKKAFQENPFFVGGNERLDSEIIKASCGKLISKTAAGGLCITINLEQEQALIVKIVDADITARSIATINALKQLKWLSEEEINTQEIKNLYDLKVKNLKNQTVGEIITKFIL